MDKYLITRDEIRQMRGLEKTHFLNRNGQRRNKSLGDLTGLRALGVHIIEVEPGFESTETHVHHFEEECVYVLQGEAEAVIGDQVHRVQAGDFIGYRAGGLAHKLVNVGDVTLRCLVAGQRLEHDVADYPAAGKRLFRAKGMPWNLVDLSAIDEVSAGKKTDDTADD